MIGNFPRLKTKASKVGRLRVFVVAIFAYDWVCLGLVVQPEDE